ncbi:MAG TPA: nitrile hydratase accessory protein [Candidatus Binataceae bacterium]
MNASEALAQLAAAAKLNPARIFSAPWELRAFAIAVSLSESGAFKWSDFRERLIEEVARGDATQSADSAETIEHYHEHFLRALERVIQEKGIFTKAPPRAEC